MVGWPSHVEFPFWDFGEDLPASANQLSQPFKDSRNQERRLAEKSSKQQRLRQHPTHTIWIHSLTTYGTAPSQVRSLLVLVRNHAAPSSSFSLPLPPPPLLLLIFPITRLYADNPLRIYLGANANLSLGASALHKPCRQYRHRSGTLTRSRSAINPVYLRVPFGINLEIGAMAPVLFQSRSKVIQHSATSLIRRLLPAIRSLTSDSVPDLSTILPTRSAQPLTSSPSSLLRRQQVIAIPTTYSNINPGSNPGQITGIVLGSVAGFILLLWLLYTVFNRGGGSGGAVVEERVVRRRSRSPRPRSVSISEIIEVQQPRHRSPAPPPRREVRRETIVVEETRRPAPVEREDDIVEVIEEHSPPPRRVRSQRNSGYRNVDPDEYGGGDRPLRKVGRR